MSNTASRRDRSNPVRDTDSTDPPVSIPEVVREQTREDPPYPVEEIRENVDALGYPVELEAVQGVGSTHADALREVGIRDMVDLAVVSFLGPPHEVETTLRDFPKSVEVRLREWGRDIHDDAILAADADGDIGRINDSPPGDFWVPVPSEHSYPKSVAVKRMQSEGVERCRSIDIVTVDGERRAVIRDPVVNDQ